MKRRVKQLWDKRPKRGSKKTTLEDAILSIPRITNETVAEHREVVLSGARKLIYPLQHSLHRVVVISASIFVVLVVAFFAYSLLALYKFNTTSSFMYRVTQVVPFPVARAGSDYVSYQDYLFELRHLMHYYQTQQGVDFNSEAGQEQLAAFRKSSLESVLNDAYIKQLARDNDVTVTDQELDEQVQLLRSQNRLGGSDEVFEDVLQEFWGWSAGDFRRELKQQLLAQKVVSKLDTEAQERANFVLSRLKTGVKFEEVAKQYSADKTSAGRGGDYGFSIDRTNRDLPPQVIDALFDLAPNAVSGIIETPLGLEIVKVREKSSGSVRASHVFVPFKESSEYIDRIKQERPVSTFISL